MTALFHSVRSERGGDLYFAGPCGDALNTIMSLSDALGCSDADSCLASGLFLASAARAVVFLEALLGNSVKCECRNGALHARGGKTPGAVGAAPAGKCFVLNPDYASIHWLGPVFGFRRKDGLPRETRGRNTYDNSSAERSPCPRRRQSPTKSRRGKVTKVLHPVWQQDINASASCPTP